MLLIITSLSYASRKPLYSMFSDNKARDLNDLVTIVISEKAQASNSTSNSSNNEQSSEFSAGPGVGGWAGAIPQFGTSAGWQNDYSGKGNTSKSGSFQATITAKIVRILPNGNFELNGTKKMIINGEEEMINISGEVRPEDISASNSVTSYQIANVQISYTGQGSMQSGAKPGVLTRMLNWFF